MKKSSEITGFKPLNKLFKDSFKRKLIQKIEAGLISSKEVKQKYGIGKSTLEEWRRLFGRQVALKRQQRLEKLTQD